MSNWVIFGVGLFVTLLVAGGLFFTVLEFRDLNGTPNSMNQTHFESTDVYSRRRTRVTGILH